MRKVKAQMIRRHQRPRLLHMLTQHLAQSGVKQMRRRMIAHGGLTNVGVDHRINLVPDLEGTPPYAVFVGWGFC